MPSNNIDSPHKQDVRAAAMDFAEALASLGEPRLFDPKRVLMVSVTFADALDRMHKITYVVTKEVKEYHGPAAETIRP